MSNPNTLLRMVSVIIAILGIIGLVLSFTGNKAIKERRFKFILLILAGALFYVLANLTK